MNDAIKLLDDIIADLDMRARIAGDVEDGIAVLDLSNGLLARYYALKEAKEASLGRQSVASGGNPNCLTCHGAGVFGTPGAPCPCVLMSILDPWPCSAPAAAQSPSVQDGRNQLHASIMNIECVVPFEHQSPSHRKAFIAGAKFIRHAAAELVAAHPDTAAIRDAVLEEAVKICDSELHFATNRNDQYGIYVAKKCSARIRALRSTPATQPDSEPRKMQVDKTRIRLCATCVHEPVSGDAFPCNCCWNPIGDMYRKKPEAVQPSDKAEPA